ncbi:MAG: hypothetical protein AB1589_13450 [Cyanobacteriota bacterium]
MLPALLKKLLITPHEADLTLPGVGKKTIKPACSKYTFLGDDGLIKGEVILEYGTNIYSNFSLTTFGLVPVTSPEGGFCQEASGKIRIDFKVNFTEGDEIDSLKGRFTLLDWASKKNQGQWKASVRSSEREVAIVKGTWSRCTVELDELRTQQKTGLMCTSAKKE